MNYFLFIASLLASHLALIAAWRQYADPLEFPQKSNEPFVFEMNVEWQLTMNFLDEVGHAHMVDYSPNDQSWWERNMDQMMDCGLSAPLQNNTALKTVMLMDGLHKRVMAINGVTPATPIVVPFGAEVIMRVKNSLMSEAISLHVHGMDKKNLWYTDGVAFVQQCPIPPGSTYSYRFIADTPGTLWIHGHLASDRGSGLLGAFIVGSDDDSATDFSNTRVHPSRQYVALIQEWLRPSMQTVSFNQQVGAIKWMYGYDDTSNCFHSTRSYDGSNVGGSMPISSIIINDKGWHNQTEIKTKPWSLPLETYLIKPNEKILLRIINGGTAQVMMVAIEGHRMTVVAADGQPVKPTLIDMLVLSSGERYDLLIEGKANPDRKHYHMIIETLEHYDLHWNKIEPFYGLGKLEYETVVNDTNTVPDFSHQNDCSLSKRCVVLNCPFEEFPKEFPYNCTGAGHLRSLEPVSDSALISDQGFENGYQEFFINWNFNVNGWAFTPPTGMPYFYNGRENDIAMWCDPNKCTEQTSNIDPGCQCFYHLNITLGNIVQITFYNFGQGPDGSEAGKGLAHPVHIHGTHFYLVKEVFPNYDNNTMEQQPSADLPCPQETVNKKCNNLQWSDKSWLNGRVGGMNTYDPSYRDTVNLPAGGYIVIRFRADNPGWFYGHCHIMLHQMGGTAFALRIGEHSQMPQPPDNFPHSCGIYEQPSISQSLPSSAQPMTMNLHHNSSYVYRILLIAVFMLICDK